MLLKMLHLVIFLLVSICALTGPALGEEPPEPELPAADAAPKEVSPAEPVAPWFPRLLGLQFNGVYQNMPSFRSPYQGPNSLSFRDGLGQDITHTYGLYLGSQLTPTLQAYLDFEMFRGYGISNGVGLGGFVNGDVIRAGPSNLPKDPYIARAYFRYFHPLSPKPKRWNAQWTKSPETSLSAGGK